MDFDYDNGNYSKKHKKLNKIKEANRLKENKMISKIKIFTIINFPTTKKINFNSLLKMNKKKCKINKLLLFNLI